jgi:hypothetical protein
MDSASQQPISPHTSQPVAEDPELTELKKQLQENRLDGLRQYLSRTRTERDWQDRLFVLESVCPGVSLDVLDAACAAEPEAADLPLIRCAYYSDLAWKMRGSATSDQVGNARFRNAADCVKAALVDAAKSTQLDDQDPTCHTLMLGTLRIFSQHEMMQNAFVKATTIAPDLVPAYLLITKARSERWGGSHAASLDFARMAMTKARPQSDMATCLFMAHWLVLTHLSGFDKNQPAADRYRRNTDVVRELDTAFDNWVAPPYVAGRSSIPLLRNASQWYRSAKNEIGLQKAIAFTKEDPTPARPAKADAFKVAMAQRPTGRSWLDRILGSKR